MYGPPRVMASSTVGKLMVERTLRFQKFFSVALLFCDHVFSWCAPSKFHAPRVSKPSRQFCK